MRRHAAQFRHRHPGGDGVGEIVHDPLINEYAAESKPVLDIPLPAVEGLEAQPLGDADQQGIGRVLVRRQRGIPFGT